MYKLSGIRHTSLFMAGRSRALAFESRIWLGHEEQRKTHFWLALGLSDKRKGWRQAERTRGADIV